MSRYRAKYTSSPSGCHSHMPATELRIFYSKENVMEFIQLERPLEDKIEINSTLRIPSEYIIQKYTKCYPAYVHPNKITSVSFKDISKEIKQKDNIDSNSSEREVSGRTINTSIKNNIVIRVLYPEFASLKYGQEYSKVEYPTTSKDIIDISIYYNHYYSRIIQFREDRLRGPFFPGVEYMPSDKYLQDIRGNLYPNDPQYLGNGFEKYVSTKKPEDMYVQRKGKKILRDFYCKADKYEKKERVCSYFSHTNDYKYNYRIHFHESIALQIDQIDRAVKKLIKSFEEKEEDE